MKVDDLKIKTLSWENIYSKIRNKIDPKQVSQLHSFNIHL